MPNAAPQPKDPQRTGLATPPALTPEQVAEALKLFRGMVYVAAEHLGCDLATVYSFIETHAMVRAALDVEEGKMLDMTELKLVEAVLRGEPWAIALYLKTKGKARGYPDGQSRGEGRRMDPVVARLLQQGMQGLEG